MLKRPRSLFVVEGVDETEALVKELLRFGVLRGDGMVEGAEPFHEVGGLLLGAESG
jgi:hypothetical protein